MDSALHCDDTLFFKKIKKIGNDIVLQLLELEVLIFMQPSSSISAITRYVKVHLIMLIDQFPGLFVFWFMEKITLCECGNALMTKTKKSEHTLTNHTT